MPSVITFSGLSPEGRSAWALCEVVVKSEGLSMAEVLRDYIKTLTPPKGGRTTSHDFNEKEYERLKSHAALN